MDTQHLKSFLRIAETGSISRAAQSLGLAQPSLSQLLLRLEDELRFSLFRRTARGVTLTEAGRIFEERARNLLRSAELAVEDLREMSAEPSGLVLLAVPYSISRLAGVALVEEFLASAPNINFRLIEAVSGQIRGWLEGSSIDIGIMHDTGPLRGLTSRPLASEELYLAGPAGRFGAGKSLPEVSLAEAAAMKLILPGPPHGLRQILDHEASRLGLALNVRLEVDAIAHYPGLIAAGHGCAILPLPAIAEALAAKKLSIARLEQGSIRRTLCLMRNSGQIVTHASIRAEDLTIKTLSGLIEKNLWRAEPDQALR